MLRATSLALVVIGLLLGSVASADVLIQMKETRNPGSKKPKVSTGWVTFNADRIATGWDDAAKHANSRFIFRGDKELFWLVDDHDKRYRQIDKAFIDQVSAEKEEMNAAMKERMAQMPAEQRAKAEAMMKKFAARSPGAGPSIELDYRKTTQTRTILGHHCTEYDVYRGDDLAAHTWVAPYSELGLTPKDGEVFQKMGEFAAKLSGTMGNLEKQDFIPMHEVGGIPLLSQQVENGKIESETVVESVKRGASPPGKYDVPAGYQMESMPTMGKP